jgi:hypothetical protein
VRRSEEVRGRERAETKSRPRAEHDRKSIESLGSCYLLFVGETNPLVGGAKILLGWQILCEIVGDVLFPRFTLNCPYSPLPWQKESHVHMAFDLFDLD